MEVPSDRTRGEMFLGTSVRYFVRACPGMAFRDKWHAVNHCEVCTKAANNRVSAVAASRRERLTFRKAIALELEQAGI